MDARVERTRLALQSALFALARERPLDEVSVADIAATAGVNRSSFYQHYSDKETLLADALDAAAEHASTGLPSVVPAEAAPPKALHDYLEHLAENAEVYRRVLGATGSAVVMARLRTRLEKIVIQGISANETPAFANLPVDVVAAGIAGSALGVIESWLSRDPLPSVAIATDWVWRILLGPGLPPR